jgi:cysteine desulfurase
MKLPRDLAGADLARALCKHYGCRQANQEGSRPHFCEEWGNPSSAYKFGSKLKGVIETARAQVAELIGEQRLEIISTSCATESNNAAIHAALKANPGKRHIVTSAVEHSSVLNYCKALELS